MRSPIPMTLGLLWVALVACGAPRPSLVLITLDTVRCDHVGALGGTPGLTPRLDALADEGLVFERAMTTMPTTGPAHVSLFTGLHPSAHGSLANGEPVSTRAAERSLAARLAAGGYATAGFVTTRLLAEEATALPGFEIYEAPRGVLRPGTEAVDAALAWLGAERRRPLLLWVHLYDAHAPYGDADHKRRNVPLRPGHYGFLDPGSFPDVAGRERLAGLYATGVREADAALGRLIDGLAGHFERPPLIAIAGDHGETLAERLSTRGYGYDHGEFLDPETVCIPLVLAGPGVRPGRSATPVSLADLYGTLVRAAGLDAGEGPDVDLRVPPAGSRVVVVERRRSDPGAGGVSRSHAAAAFDADHGVIVGEDGSAVWLGLSRGPDELRLEALRHAAELARQPGTPPLDPQLTEALRSLGYAR